MRIAKKISAALFLILTVATLSLLTFQTIKLPKVVSVSLTADQESYEAGESIIATLTAQNTSSKTISDITMEILLPKNCLLTKGSPASTKELWGLEGNEESSMSVVLSVPDDASDAAQNSGSSILNTLEAYKSHVEITVLAIAILGMVVLIVFSREQKVFLSVLFVCSIFIGAMFPFALQVARSTFLHDKVKVEYTIPIDDRELCIQGIVSYSALQPKGERPTDIYTVIFDVGGGSPVAAQSVETGAYLSAPETPTLDGYLFAGWYTDRALTEYFTFSEQPIIEDMVLYAMWVDESYDLDSDGDGISDDLELYYGSDPYTADDTETDTDGDELVDYLEIYVYGTDINDPDTDKDGLSDYEEAALVGTDPTLADSNGDGTDDYNSDEDADGIYNGFELELGTDPRNSDTDGDALDDYDEIHLYQTEPLLFDTDGDGASDSWEIENGYDPLTYNGDFSISAEASSDDGSITAGVSLNCSGDPASLSVEETTEAGLLSDSMPGYVGSAFSFSVDASFESATITFTFDSNKIPEDADLSIYYFNEETQLLEPLETTISDGQATAVVTHFSTYVLLNRKLMDQVWEKEILAPGSATYNNTVFNIAFVIDYSASMNNNDPEDLRLSIVDEFIGKLRDGQDYASVIKFAAYATTLVPLTTDKIMLSNAVTGITNASSDGCDSEAGTNGSDGLHTALEQLESAEGDYRYIIFLTDGEDTTSSYEYSDLIAEAVANNIIIYSIGMGDADEELLKGIAESTGGNFYYATAVEQEDITGTGLMDAFYDIEISTIDFETDSNNDGISDYYTRLLCNGTLRTGTGVALFEGMSFEDVQANADYDGDGVLNGDEVIIRHDESSGKTYLYVVSSPTVVDTDTDGIPDDEDTLPLEKGLVGGIIGKMVLISCGETPASTIVIDQVSGGELNVSTGHAFIIYISYVNDVIDLSKFNFGYSTATGSFTDYTQDDPLPTAYTLSVNDAISMSAGGTSQEDAKCAVYNLEFVKHVVLGVAYSPNAYLEIDVTQKQLDTLFCAFKSESAKSYDGVNYNCTDVSLNVWNQVFNSSLNTEGILHLVNIHTPRGLKCAIEKMDDGQSNLDLNEIVY